MNSLFTVMFESLKVFLIFTGFTLLFYYGFVLVTQQYSNYHRYDEPSGKAIKAAVIADDLDSNWYSRLIYYIHTGE